MAEKIQEFSRTFTTLDARCDSNKDFALGYIKAKEQWQQVRNEVIKDVRQRVKFLKSKGVPAAKIPADVELADLAEELHAFDNVLTKAESFAKTVSAPLAKATQTLETQVAAEIRARSRQASTVLKLGNHSLPRMRHLHGQIRDLKNDRIYRAIVAITPADTLAWRNAIKTTVPTEVTKAIKAS